MSLQKTKYEDMILNKDFTNLGYYVVFLANAPEIMCSGSTQATHDFLGKKVAAVERLDMSVQSITLSLIATDDGGAAVFTWLADENECHNVMMTLSSLPKADQPHAIVRFAFEFLENTYFSPEWWDGLNKRAQAHLEERQLRGLIDDDSGFYRWRPDNCLLDDRVRTVNWTVRSCLTSLTGP